MHYRSGFWIFTVFKLDDKSTSLKLVSQIKNSAVSLNKHIISDVF